MRVSGIAYIKSRLSLNVLKCKQLGPFKLLSSCHLTAASKRISFRLVEASAKDVNKNMIVVNKKYLWN